MLNVALVIWRESFEAFLIVGILFAAVRNWSGIHRPQHYLLAGIGLGVGLSLTLAFLFLHAQTELEGRALEYFEVGMMTLAALLMTHMCVWMQRHAPHLKRQIQADVQAVPRSRLLGLSLLAALAVTREGAEIVIFLFGMHTEASGQALLFWSSVGLGVAGTGLTAWAYVKGLKFFKPSLFFKVTGVFLLFTACSLFVSAARKLIQMEVLPPLREQVWDTSFLLDERSSLGQAVSLLTGYESAPSLSIVLTLLTFWLLTLGLFFAPAGAKTPR